ncbi:hypothetical protein D3C87_1148670 [compost metagenome]
MIDSVAGNAGRACGGRRPLLSLWQHIRARLVLDERGVAQKFQPENVANLFSGAEETVAELAKHGDATAGRGAHDHEQRQK